MSHNITVEGGTSVRLPTAGKYCDRDIIVTAENLPDVGSSFDLYDGEYDVTPKVEAQTLPTKQKFMSDDVNVKAIPRYDVSNNSGGTTVYIAFME